MIDSRDIRWLAGWLEGEGCFQMRRFGNRTPIPIIAANSTDEDVVKRASKILGGKGKTYFVKVTHKMHKPAWTKVVSSTLAVSWMMTLYSLMGKRRQAKIKEILDEWKTQRRPFTRRECGLRTHALKRMKECNSL